MPYSDAEWDKSVEWFDYQAASKAFLESCGPYVVLISLEVERAEKRKVVAIFEVRGCKGLFATAGHVKQVNNFGVFSAMQALSVRKRVK